jgi:hypothetical protein
MLMPLASQVNKSGDFILRDIDFSYKNFENMNMRKDEITNNQHTLKTYLVSYFKYLFVR